MRLVKMSVSFATAIVLLSVMAGSAGAYSNVTESGMVGHWSLNDTSGTPGATCRYGDEYPPNYAGFKWMSVQPPVVFAADRNSGKIDRKTVKWFWKLQRAHYPMDDWKTVETSATQTATAYENQSAPFSALRIRHNVGNPDFSDVVFRAKVFIRWIKMDGTVEGMATATIDYYKIRAFSTEFVAGSPWCQKVATTG